QLRHEQLQICRRAGWVIRRRCCGENVVHTTVKNKNGNCNTSQFPLKFQILPGCRSDLSNIGNQPSTKII
ncbi:MAG: hypothetical protein Q7U00_02185, partial [Sulfurimonas sp.]|nr:hypothetical protein [Sulfurimonas sp.]